MPSNEDFGFKICIGCTAVEEYAMGGKYYVECNLFTPVSFQQKSSEVINGEVETQSSPVTPYEIEISASPRAQGIYYYRTMVDGMKVKGVSLHPGESRIVKGFRDGINIRELLFSMPRFAKDQTDRLSADRVSQVGQIEVQCWEATLQNREWKLRSKELNFTQATKKDSDQVTKGQFMMTTSKPGRILNSRGEYRCVDQWHPTRLRSSLIVHYRMGSELRSMGLVIKQLRLKRNINSLSSDDEDDKKFDVKSKPKRLSTRSLRSSATAAVLLPDLDDDDDDDKDGDVDTSYASTSGRKTRGQMKRMRERQCSESSTPGCSRRSQPKHSMDTSANVDSEYDCGKHRQRNEVPLNVGLDVGDSEAGGAETSGTSRRTSIKIDVDEGGSSGYSGGQPMSKYDGAVIDILSDDGDFDDIQVLESIPAPAVELLDDDEIESNLEYQKDSKTDRMRGGTDKQRESSRQNGESNVAILKNVEPIISDKTDDINMNRTINETLSVVQKYSSTAAESADVAKKRKDTAEPSDVAEERKNSSVDAKLAVVTKVTNGSSVEVEPVAGAKEGIDPNLAAKPVDVVKVRNNSSAVAEKHSDPNVATKLADVVKERSDSSAIVEISVVEKQIDSGVAAELADMVKEKNDSITAKSTDFARAQNFPSVAAGMAKSNSEDNTEISELETVKENSAVDNVDGVSHDLQKNAD